MIYKLQNNEDFIIEDASGNLYNILYLLNQKMSKIPITPDNMQFDIDITTPRVIISVYFPSEATGTATITIESEGIEETADVEDGKTRFTIESLGAGSYEFNVYYSGDRQFTDASISDSFTVES